MTFDRNIQLFKILIKRYGWTLNKEDVLYEYFTNFSSVQLQIPKLKEDKGYPVIFNIALNKIKRQNPEIAQLPIFNIILSQLKNIQQKYSLDKNDWILAEPNSKYHFDEIPNIYIPQSHIFEKDE